MQEDINSWWCNNNGLYLKCRCRHRVDVKGWWDRIALLGKQQSIRPHFRTIHCVRVLTHVEEEEKEEEECTKAV